MSGRLHDRLAALCWRPRFSFPAGLAPVARYRTHEAWWRAAWSATWDAWCDHQHARRLAASRKA